MILWIHSESSPSTQASSLTSGTKPGLSKDIYILTIHDDTILDTTYDPSSFGGKGGPYFKITKTSYTAEHSDAYEVDIGYNTSTIVRNFNIEQNENFSLYYDYQNEIHSEDYARRLNKQGEWETVYSPNFMVRAIRTTIAFSCTIGNNFIVHMTIFTCPPHSFATI